MKKNIQLDLIKIDSGTQQRSLDGDVITQYMALMADGIEFPPIEVVSDGVNFWLWDGFHRYRCAQERGQKSIFAYVTEGKLRDAIWLSFGANKDHGLPRQRGLAKKIIAAILTDESWSKKSLSAIAKHIGVTREYVSKTKAELSAHGVNSSHHRKDENGDSESKTAQRAEKAQRDEEIEVERGGTTYEQKSQEKESKTSEPPKDAEPPKDTTGRVIPEHLREFYASRIAINGILKGLARINKDVMKQVDTRDPAFSLLNITAFQVNYGNLRRTLKSALPYAVCCYCGGEDSKNCKACQGFGLLNHDSYEAAPKELKL